MPLIPVFLVTQTIQGEGYLDEVMNMAFINSLDVVSPGVCNLWFDLEHSQAGGEHVIADTEAE